MSPLWQGSPHYRPWVYLSADETLRLFQAKDLATVLAADDLRLALERVATRG